MDIVNNKMLVTARESRGKTQQDLVAMIPNLNQGNYSKMEKGLLGVPNETLFNIAKELGYPKSFFYKKEARNPISSFYYRKRVSMSKKDLGELEAQLDIMRMCIDELLDSVEVPEFTLPRYEISDTLTATEAAVKLREFLKIPKGPIKNLVRALEAAGVIVCFVDTDVDKFDGITLITDNGHPVIFINSSLPNDRKRFTIAHETIHLASHIPYSPLAAERDSEQEANEGAGELLMPYLECRNELHGLRYSQLSILKSYWGVSKAMVLFRAKEIGAISPEKCTNMYIELSRHGQRKMETGLVHIDSPTLLRTVIKTHEIDLNYSLDDMLEMLSLNSEDYFKFFPTSIFDHSIKTSKVIEFNPKQNTA